MPHDKKWHLIFFIVDQTEPSGIIFHRDISNIDLDESLVLSLVLLVYYFLR